MPKYHIRTTDGQILTKLPADPHPNWELPEGHAVIELDEDIPVMETRFWKWTGKELVVDSYKRDRQRQLDKALKWILNELPARSWEKLNSMEKKLVMGRNRLSESEENQMITQWVEAGEPEEG